MIVADTDVLIEALRGREPSAGRIRREFTRGTLATTAVSAFELLSGAGTRETLEPVETLLRGLLILPLDEGAGKLAASVRRRLEARGEPIGMADYLIAGICLARSTPLLTRNRRHFERVPGLELGEL
jgi:tRNA(fMet)-specific endonuclease VapC